MRLFVFCILFLAHSSPLFTAEDPGRLNSIADLVQGTDRHTNFLVIEILAGEDYTDSVSAVQALGERADVDVNVIITYLLEQHSREGNHRREHLLRILLRSVFPPSQDADELNKKIEINRGGIAALLQDPDRFENLYITGLIFRLCPFLDSGIKTLYTGGRKIEGMLREQSGCTDPDRTNLILEYLSAVKFVTIETVGSTGNPNLAANMLPILGEICLSIYELTENPAIAERSLLVSKRLLVNDR